MTNKSVLRTMGTCVVSLLFAFVAFSSLTIGSASAHPLSQLHLRQAGALTSTQRSCPSNVVRLENGGPFGVKFNCQSITVKVGRPVVFVNTTNENRIVVYDGHVFLIVSLHSRAELMTFTPGQIPIFIYNHPDDPHSQLLVTVIK